MAKSAPGQVLQKSLTGIKGFDEISLGGLPRNRTTLVMGGPGTGKSVFALQSLVGAASKHKQPGIFVAFEENIDAIFANAAAFEVSAKYAASGVRFTRIPAGAGQVDWHTVPARRTRTVREF